MGSEGNYVVAIGASAGGLEAIHEFFDNLPPHTNISYVIIQHLSPDYKSLLVELVSRHTEMKVYEAEDNMPLQINSIYVIPNNKLMTIKGDKLLLEDKTAAKIPNNAIDVFLHSLARDKKEFAIAVILSGTGTDGTRGIDAIKKNNGLVIVQDPASARFNGMPNSAIHSGNVDHILTPSAIPEEITNYTQDRETENHLAHVIDESLLERIFMLIHRAAGFDFNYYKTPTIVRRIQRRMLRGGFKDINSYVNHLERDAEECKQLGKDFLIGVTKFFRDREAFEFLSERVIQPLVQEKEYGETIKVWVTACSTGEEAYSIAILLNEAIERQNKQIDLKIFASDLESTNVDIASRGVYPDTIEKDVDQSLLNKYFIKTGKHYAVIPKIRKQIVFAYHNIIKDPPFIKNDLVTCRNMLIYMNPMLQQRVYSLLLFSVKRDGFMFFGSSENPSYVKDSVVELHSKFKIYRKVNESKLSIGHQMDVPERPAQREKVLPTRKAGESTLQTLLWDDFRKTLASEMIFSALYIDSNFDVKEAIGNYEQILTLPKKNLRLNLLRMVPPQLSAILNSTISKAWKTNQPVHLRNVRYEDEKEMFSLQIFVKPAQEITNCSLVVFTHHQKIEEPASNVHPIDPDMNQSDYVRSLESELVETKNNLQLVVEDLETVNEELQSSNEELLSANEELQSSNEELQSLNEELHTLNTEHQLKIKELLELNDDLNNYFRSTDIGQIFVTSDLRIRKFNTASARMINFIESDLGRPIAHISTNIRYENLNTDIETVLRKGTLIEREVQLLNGRNVLMRVLPYITRDQKSDGVIVSFIDITAITNLNNIVRGVFNASQSAIFAFNSVRSDDFKIEDFKVVTSNHAANRFLNSDQINYNGKSLKKDIPLLCINGMFEKYVDVVLHDVTLREDLYVESEGTWYDISAVKMMDGFVATCNDITEKKVAEQRLKKNYGELVAAKDNLKRLNDDLENKVVERTQALSKSEERFRIVSQATNDAIWDWDFSQNKVWYGEGFLKLFGHRHKNNESARAEWLELIHPDDRAQTKESLFHIINTQQNQWSHEYRFRRADGSYANVLDRGYVLHDENGTPYRMLGSMLDLTELKRAELEVENNIAQREFLAESMPLIVCVADPDFGLSFVNNQFNRYTGLSFEEVFDKGWSRIMHHDDYDQFVKAWEGARDRQHHFEIEVRLFHQGEYHWNLLRANARMQNDRVIMNWVLTFIDIHAQKSLNETLEKMVKSRTEQLQRMNEALEASNHDLQQFASVASHDLQEPLRKIHMFSKLVRDKGVSLPDDSKRYLDKIMQASSRMKSIITNVLNFSRLSADDNKFESVDLGELIGDLLEDLEVAIKERGARVDIGAFCRLEVIPGQMRQVFQNLISNSLKFSRPDAPPHIRISSETVGERSFESKSEKDGPYCRITIRDNGIGFNEKFKENIFDLFHRLHSKDTYEGTGIGLAIVKKILEKHGGIITANSKEDEGATFVIVLPVEHQEVQKKVNHYDQANIISG